MNSNFVKTTLFISFIQTPKLLEIPQSQIKIVDNFYLEHENYYLFTKNSVVDIYMKYFNSSIKNLESLLVLDQNFFWRYSNLIAKLKVGGEFIYDVRLYRNVNQKFYLTDNGIFFNHNKIVLYQYRDFLLSCSQQDQTILTDFGVVVLSKIRIGREIHTNIKMYIRRLGKDIIRGVLLNRVESLYLADIIGEIINYT